MAALLLIALGWGYIVVLMAAAEALGPDGTVVGAAMTLVGYGVLPLGVVLYIGTTGLRRRERERLELEARAAVPDATAPSAPSAPSAADDPAGGGHPPGTALAPEREEP
jgi:hypothetical protein